MENKERMKNGLNAYYNCRNSIDKNWGLRPNVVYWLYISIVRPVITYECLVWRKAMRFSSYRKLLTKVQRYASHEHSLKNWKTVHRREQSRDYVYYNYLKDCQKYLYASVFTDGWKTRFRCSRKEHYVVIQTTRELQCIPASAKGDSIIE